MKSFSTIAVCMFLTGCASQPSGPPPPPPKLVCNEIECQGPDAERLELGKSEMASKMNVPSKAEFKGVFLTDRAVCGEVTGVNGFGGYPPPRQFMVAEGKVNLRPADQNNAKGFKALGIVLDQRSFDGTWRHYCGHEGAYFAN